MNLTQSLALGEPRPWHVITPLFVCSRCLIGRFLFVLFVLGFYNGGIDVILQLKGPVFSPEVRFDVTGLMHHHDSMKHLISVKIELFFLISSCANFVYLILKYFLNIFLVN